MKQEEIKRVEVYYERIQKLAHGLQVPTTNSFLLLCLGKTCNYTLNLQL
jgi:hypothetical protein